VPRESTAPPNSRPGIEVRTFAPDSSILELLIEGRDILRIYIEREDPPDRLCLLLIYYQLAVEVIAQRNIASHPHAFLFRGGDFVADTLTGYLSLKLSEREQNIEGQSAHGSGGIELLGDETKLTF
jgi:hypothetical protein